MVTDQSLLTSVTTVAVVTAAKIHGCVVLSDVETTRATVAAVAVVAVALVIQCTVAANVSSGTRTQERAVCVGACCPIQTPRGIHLTLIDVFITVPACEACVTVTQTPASVLSKCHITNILNYRFPIYERNNARAASTDHTDVGN